MAEAAVRLGEIRLTESGAYWLEGRAREGGRQVLVHREPSGAVRDLIPPPFNARSRVHEYGGGSVVLGDDGSVYFSNFSDQQLYEVAPGGEPRRLTDARGSRFADGVLDRSRRRLITVLEAHEERDHEPVNRLATVRLADGRVTSLVDGHDFYAAPRISPDGTRIAWIAWSHPDMPWDASELWVADLLADGGLASSRRIAGGAGESVFAPEWAADGSLYFVSDRTGWWNLYRWRHGRLDPVLARAAEFGIPQWALGESTYGIAGDGRLVAAFAERGRWQLARIDPDAGRLDPIPVPFDDIAQVRARGDDVLLLAGGAGHPLSVVLLDPRGRYSILAPSSSLEVHPGYVSRPEAIEFPTFDGSTAHGFFYPPANADYAGPDGERPPLIVLSHGGPTAAAGTRLDPKLQFWTSRGFAVLDVNYAGSTGYGRAYRRRLEGRWGLADVEDCIHGARALVERGLVDGRRLIVRGGSAGGYTTLAALTFHDTFRTGASYYGIGDLEALARDTHKFESRYLDRLVAPYPDGREIYYARSPLHHADRLSSPVIFFQGLEDKVVPPAQSETMVAAMKARGVPVAYLAFEGEQHGFRQARTIARALEAELWFYARVLGFDLDEPVEPVAIDGRLD